VKSGRYSGGIVAGIIIIIITMIGDIYYIYIEREREPADGCSPGFIISVESTCYRVVKSDDDAGMRRRRTIVMAYSYPRVDGPASGKTAISRLSIWQTTFPKYILF